MAAGLCAVFDYPLKFNISEYVTEELQYRRCPDSKYLFSRDQAICLMAGLYKRHYEFFVSADYINGKDILSPSVRGHIRRCQGLTASWLQDKWLWLDIWFHATCTPRGESNQLLCMMMIADPKFLKHWCEANSFWEFSIRDYWGSWRQEPELAELMIRTITEKIKKP